MRSRRDIEKQEERVNNLANKKIEIIEKKRGSKVKNLEVAKVFESAENYVKEKNKLKAKKQKRKWRNRIIAILGALGITIGGGHALLTSGESQENNIKVSEENNSKEDSNSKFREDIKVDTTEEYDIQEYAINEKLVDEILECYNSKLNDENKIDKTDLRNNTTK